jgi:Carboxypeptidase regulatory-like domain
MLDLAFLLLEPSFGGSMVRGNQGNLNCGDCDDENRGGEMKLRSLLCCLFFILGIAGRVCGQGGDVGSIVGTITDATGAAVANAKVLVTNTATNISKEITTSDTGNYTVPYLRPGVYRVTVEAAGFDESVVDNISLVVAQERRVDVALKVGAVTTKVEVSAGALALDTESAAVAQVVSRTQVEELPLNGRNFLNLLFITAGAVQTVGEQGRCAKGLEMQSASMADGQSPITTPWTAWPIRTRP